MASIACQKEGGPATEGAIPISFEDEAVIARGKSAISTPGLEGRRQIQSSVAIEVSSGNGESEGSGYSGEDRGLECSVSITEEYLYCSSWGAATISRQAIGESNNIELAVAIDISKRESLWIIPGLILYWRFESPVSVPQKYSN